MLSNYLGFSGGSTISGGGSIFQDILEIGKTAAEWDLNKKQMELSSAYNSNNSMPPPPTVGDTANPNWMQSDWSNPTKKPLSLEKIGVIIGIIVGGIAIFKFLSK
ncbi:hypothetical protein [Terasakiella sp. SH-1]|uniref:hypothetical protein n=1 Tax=Terasakiella sp. SH-1 TaxID=2560057 RepID=UPI00107309C8|nr:hypothetical protein [Terasakiella sp. SH-1]